MQTSNTSKTLRKRLRLLMALSLTLALMGCSLIPTPPPTTDVSCHAFCDFQFDPLKSHPRDIVQAKTHNARREAVGCAPKKCLVDVDSLNEVKASQGALKRKISN